MFVRLFNTSLVCAFVEKFFDTLDTHLLLPPANEVWGKRIFSQACVSHSVHRGGGLCPGGIPDRDPLDRDPPSGQRPPRALCILLECILVASILGFEERGPIGS